MKARAAKTHASCRIAMLATLLAILLGAGSRAAAEGVRIERRDGARRVRVTADLPAAVARTLPAGDVPAAVAGKRLRLHLVLPGNKLGPPIFGGYRRSGRQLQFEPRYPLAYGNRYRAELQLSGKVQTAEYRVPPRPPSARTEVRAVYPTAQVLPSNQLKFYVHFSQPMREGPEVFERITLEDADGRRLKAPWRRRELWSVDARRLTLWLHPGRIKQGVNLRGSEGPVLLPEKKYTLVVGADLRDAFDRPLGKRYVKRFRTSPPDHLPPAPRRWKLQPPAVGSRVALQVDFGESLDAALARRLIRIRDRAGRRVPGGIALTKGETRWSFTPRQPWEAGEYRLTTSELLEDLAGNTPRRVFDRDLRRPTHDGEPLEVTFRPRK